MTAFFNGCDPMVGWILRVSGQASVLILLILLIQAVFGRRLASRWRYALWLLVVVRLLMPFSLTSSVSIFNLARLRSSAQPVARVAEAPASVGIDPQSSDPMVLAESEASEAKAPAPAPAETAATIPAAQGQTVTQISRLWRHVFILLWLVGVGILSLRILWQNAVYYWRLRWEPTVTNAEAWEVLEECRQLMGVRYRLVLVETSLAHSPALYGLLRLHLLLPEKTLEAFSAEELRYVFLHELAHVKRWDMLVNWFVTFLQVVHWFNPLVWLAFRRMSADRELAADALALSCLEGQEDRAYGQAIIKLLHNLLSPAALPGVVGILEDKNQMKRRMYMITHFRSARHGSVLAALLFASLGLITLTDAQTKASKSLPDKDEGRRQPVIRTLATGGGVETGGILSPDETMIAYVDWDKADGFTPLMVKELAPGKRLVLADSELIKSTGDHAFAYPVIWSPDAKWLAYAWHGERVELRVVSVPNGPSKVLKAHNPEVEYRPEDWSPDGEWILCVLEKKNKTKALGMVSQAGGQVVTLR